MRTIAILGSVAFAAFALAACSGAAEEDVAKGGSAVRNVGFLTPVPIPWNNHLDLAMVPRWSKTCPPSTGITSPAFLVMLTSKTCAPIAGAGGEWSVAEVSQGSAAIGACRALWTPTAPGGIPDYRALQDAAEITEYASDPSSPGGTPNRVIQIQPDCMRVNTSTWVKVPDRGILRYAELPTFTPTPGHDNCTTCVAEVLDKRVLVVLPYDKVNVAGELKFSPTSWQSFGPLGAQVAELPLPADSTLENGTRLDVYMPAAR